MRVILAEPDAAARAAMTEVLRADGHDVLGVADGTAAWESFERDPVPLVVLNCDLPGEGLGALEVCRRVRASAAGADAFVLMLTSDAGTEDIVPAFEAGADDFTVTPVRPKLLRARVYIAERRLGADAARRATERELVQTRWLAGVGETVLTLEHELNNPLAALLAILELADDPASTPEEHRSAIPLALAQTRRIVDTMRRMASLRQPQTVERLPGVKMLKLQ